MRKSKPKAPRLQAPEGATVKRTAVGGQVRFTTPISKGFEKLVAISSGDTFLWICEGYSA